MPETSPSETPLPPLSVTAATFREMPADYQRIVIRIMSIQAYAEKLGAIGVPQWHAKVPDHRAARTVAQILADEARHAFWLYDALERVGVSEDEAVKIATEKGSASNSIEGPASLTEDPSLGWQEIVMNCMFLDRAGGFMVKNFLEGSFEPWATVCRQIHKDEAMHVAFGFTEFKKLVARRRDDPELPKLITHWYCAGLNFFGPPPGRSHQKLANWGIKRDDNETLRDAYRAEVMSILDDLGLGDMVQIEHDAYPYA